jgi:Na+-driven multidrug efflux pump
MDQTLSLGWTQAEARSRKDTYKRVLAVSLVVQAVIALLAILFPATLSHLLGLPSATPSGWLRAWGVTLLLVTLLYFPGYTDPVRVRWPNVIGILGRVGTALLFLLLGLGAGLRGFLWLALIDGVFAAALVVTYFRLFRAELMSRP